MEQSTHTIINKIEKLKKEVPSDWADVVAKQMNKSVASVRAYARGDRGLCAGYHIKVLEHLTEYHNELNSKIEKLTA